MNVYKDWFLTAVLVRWWRRSSSNATYARRVLRLYHIGILLEICGPHNAGTFKNYIPSWILMSPWNKRYDYIYPIVLIVQIFWLVLDDMRMSIGYIPIHKSIHVMYIQIYDTLVDIPDLKRMTYNHFLWPRLHVNFLLLKMVDFWNPNGLHNFYCGIDYKSYSNSIIWPRVRTVSPGLGIKIKNQICCNTIQRFQS